MVGDGRVAPALIVTQNYSARGPGGSGSRRGQRGVFACVKGRRVGSGEQAGGGIVLSVFSAKPFFRLAFLALPCLAAAGCTSSALTDGVTLSKPSSFFATPDWMKDSSSSETSLWRPISPQDLAGPDGRCAGSDVAPVTPEGAAAGAPAADTLPTAAGIGLAAPQVGVKRRVAVVDVSARDDEKVALALIDPEITWRSEETSLYDEGCLSIPDYYAEVERPSQVRVRYRDLDGVEQEIEAKGVLSTCIQHEIDHLDGVLFIDMISKLKREMVWKRFAKLAKRDGGAKPWLPKKRQPRELHEPENPAALPAGEL